MKFIAFFISLTAAAPKLLQFKAKQDIEHIQQTATFKPVRKNSLFVMQRNHQQLISLQFKSTILKSRRPHYFGIVG